MVKDDENSMNDESDTRTLTKQADFETKSRGSAKAVTKSTSIASISPSKSTVSFSSASTTTKQKTAIKSIIEELESISKSNNGNQSDVESVGENDSVFSRALAREMLSITSISDYPNYDFKPAGYIKPCNPKNSNRF